MDIVQHNGVWWPADDIWCRKVIFAGLSEADAALNLVSDRTLAVQAGGNVGVWASHFAKTFAHVVTVEPDVTNYECLKRNVPGNVEHQRAGFGAEPGTLGLTKIAGNAGAHYVGGKGEIPIVTIDGLKLDACDLICLDIEGSEPAALRGAEQTICAFRPVILFEEKGLSEQYYGIKRGTAEQWLTGLGYVVAHKSKNDVVMVAK